MIQESLLIFSQSMLQRKSLRLTRLIECQYVNFEDQISDIGWKPTFKKYFLPYHGFFFYQRFHSNEISYFI